MIQQRTKHRKLIWTTTLTVLLSVTVTPIKAATPSIADKVAELVVTTPTLIKGYGPFHWGDGPNETGDVSCTANENIPFYQGINSGVGDYICFTTKGLPDIGSLKAIGATYQFRQGKLSEICIDLDKNLLSITGQPEDVTITQGQIELKYIKGKKQPIIILSNSDPDNRKEFAKQSVEILANSGNFSEQTPVKDFYATLSSLCPSCAIVLEDYLTAIGQAHVNATIAQGYFTQSPIVGMLLAQKEACNNENYQKTLERIRNISAKVYAAWENREEQANGRQKREK